MRRFGLWFVSAAVALPVYALASAADLSNVVVLLLTFAGAIAGALLGSFVMQRR